MKKIVTTRKREQRKVLRPVQPLWRTAEHFRELEQNRMAFLEKERCRIFGHMTECAG